MTGSLALVVTSALYLTMVLDHPFSGDHRIESVQFGEAVELMEQASDERVEATCRAILGPRWIPSPRACGAFRRPPESGRVALCPGDSGPPATESG